MRFLAYALQRFENDFCRKNQLRTECGNLLESGAVYQIVGARKNRCMRRCLAGQR